MIELERLAMIKRPFKPGELVVYTKEKYSSSPGPRAKHVWPAPAGETYTYTVDKLWLVVGEQDGKLLLKTRRGKEHLIAPDDPHLRRPSLWERVRFRGRFS
jgi:hypothetical protein